MDLGIICNKVVSVAANSWFDKAHLSKAEVLEFCYLCSFEMQQLEFDSRISSRSTTDWSSFCRQVCIDAVITQPKPIGGPVERRDAATLVPFIQEYILPFRDYEFQHLTVNHRKNFKDPVPGVHTN